MLVEKSKMLYWYY